MKYFACGLRVLLSLIFCCAMPFAVSPAEAVQVQCNPSPASDDLILPGPEGNCFVFRAVGIGGGDNPLEAQKRFSLGNPKDYLGEKPTDMTLGGSFILQKAQVRDWVYYLGKYEVTEGQYYAIMGLPKGLDATKLQSRYPITNISVFEMMAFIEKLNIYLYEKAMDSVPKIRSTPGFVRLPTEPEWEFAARGGNQAPAHLFGNNVPYEGSLAAYEWFSGPSSSHNKVQEVGKLKPNHLGLHDMLGNVSELILSPFHIDYYQGRPGGFTARGGNYFTQEKDMRTSQRQEEPLFMGDVKKGMKPNKKVTMGFRLALVAPVLPDKEAMQEIKAAWETYIASPARAQTPAGRSNAPVDVQTTAKVEDAEAYVAKVRNYVDASQSPEDVKLAIASIHSIMRDISEIRKETDKRIAEAFVDVATKTGARLGREMEKRPKISALIKSAQETKDEAGQTRYQRMLEGVDGNIGTDMAELYKILQSLTALNPDLVNAAFDAHSQYLTGPSRVDKAQWPLAALPRVREMYTLFFKNKGLDNAVMTPLLEQIKAKDS